MQYATPYDKTADRTADLTAASGPVVPLAALNDWLSTSQAARELGLSQQRILQMAESGDFGPVANTVHGRLFNPDAVDAVRQSREAM